MPIATLYDVHGNIRALEAVLQEIPDDASIVVGGDVAVGPQPAETLERLRALGNRVLWLRGNADRELTPGEPALAPAGALDAVRAQLTNEQIAFLHGLPPTVQIERVLFESRAV
jgi:predicted phosphodiesterase